MSRFICLKFSSFTYAVFLIAVCIVFFYGSAVIDREEDEFLLRLNSAAESNREGVDKILKEYIKIGSELLSVIDFLEKRGFKVDREKPGDWHESLGTGEIRYHAYKSSTKNIVILVTISIVLLTDGVVVTGVSGRIHITGI